MLGARLASFNTRVAERDRSSDGPLVGDHDALDFSLRHICRKDALQM